MQKYHRAARAFKALLSHHIRTYCPMFLKFQNQEIHPKYKHSFEDKDKDYNLLSLKRQNWQSIRCPKIAPI